MSDSKPCQCAWHSLPEGNYKGHLVIGQEPGGLYVGLIKELVFQDGSATLTPDPLYILNTRDNTWSRVKQPSYWGDTKACSLHRHHLWKNFFVWSIANIATIFIYEGKDSMQGFTEISVPPCHELIGLSTS